MSMRITNTSILFKTYMESEEDGIQVIKVPKTFPPKINRLSAKTVVRSNESKQNSDELGNDLNDSKLDILRGTQATEPGLYQPQGAEQQIQRLQRLQQQLQHLQEQPLQTDCKQTSPSVWLVVFELLLLLYVIIFWIGVGKQLIFAPSVAKLCRGRLFTVLFV